MSAQIETAWKTLCELQKKEIDHLRKLCAEAAPLMQCAGDCIDSEWGDGGEEWAMAKRLEAAGQEKIAHIYITLWGVMLLLLSGLRI